jgi:dihydroorotate dehydrogenase electron transfer subunit
MKQVVTPVVSNSEVMPGTHLIWLECPEIAAEAKPGQFVMVRCGEGTLLRRPLSIHLTSKKTRLALLVRTVGKGTRWLVRCQTGDKLDLLGPLGNGFTIKPESRNLLIVAGGIGIAPMAFLAQEASRQGHTVRLLLGAASARHLYPARFLPAVSELALATEDGSTGAKGMITEILPDYLNHADQLYACGPLAMYKDMANKYARQLKDKSVQVSLEMRMGCGLGICYACTIKTKDGLKQVCKDGPVFEMNEVVWEELKDI